MSLIARSTELDIMAKDVGQYGRRFRSDAEIAIREKLEIFCRDRWAGARLFHELNMQLGKVRADVVAIDPQHMAAFEIKGPFDSMDRVIQQVAYFRLSVPELWLVVADTHIQDAEVVRYLMPSVGVICAKHAKTRMIDLRREVHFDSWRGTVNRDDVTLEVIHEAEHFAPYPTAMLSLLWVNELAEEARRANLLQAKTTPTHKRLVELMLKLTDEEQLRAVCRQIRARETAYKADTPIKE